MRTLAERFWEKVRITPGCWLWTGARHSAGYGVFRINGKTLYAHRGAYEECVGPIPPGLQLDHVRTRGCTHRNCVNPDHLEPVTPQENMRRGDGGKYSAAKTHCPRGHAYDAENTYVYRSRRRCRNCIAAQVRLRRGLACTA